MGYVRSNMEDPVLDIQGVEEGQAMYRETAGPGDIWYYRRGEVTAVEAEGKARGARVWEYGGLLRSAARGRRPAARRGCSSLATRGNTRTGRDIVVREDTHY